MRYRKGSKVEVLSKQGVPSGFWRCAEIICGNGHTYTVRYEGHASTIDETVMERISRNAIRPCPPLPEIAEDWVPGDVVEVFDDFSWKTATISKMLGKKYFLVRIIGSSLEFKVSKFDIRTRQSWQDDEWIVIGKGPGSCEGAKHDNNSTTKCERKSMNNVRMAKTRLNERVKNDCFPKVNKENLQEPNIVSNRTLKRGPYGYKQAEAHDGAAQKFRAVEKEGRLHRWFATNQFPLLEQVDDFAFPTDMVGEKFMHPSFNDQTGFSAMDVERRKQTGAVGCSSAVELESNDEDGVTSSVGSCSITSNNFCKFRSYAGFIEDNDGCSSDAESFCQWGCGEENVPFPMKEDLATEIHRLELHAYRCTMEALFASGPLSWEQEALVTNLRLSLHISNDEHLMEGQSRRLVHLTSQC
ncbi:uncharacterized protein LOC110630693 isoform X2 [Manihot esculenta]|uniref:Uncharacterized protein n=6 Tax=Manihot esculenta TaxID=3983 RepID=A0ACB7GHB0_MANES|nr:uncharacterized protein LOC110630693 isoform X2 [Manihot esculenta]KAG8639264.1 hypothetical protein MANES_14G129100v8 [Manihot esculenta]KAG8639265.1 hypothetical protein MANES_14G129100v8 [Manihot esculenta]KAG8639266.1 hypothetical protein MANES_14G129100v8 [Manihot esculenta]KAG8639267.1 hypothetical protein MANES_14G129100v8 [Manihot esculenta]KAG8639268.1 hypothetical protein MANES_14G129100v8 [Manihot esculenta]